jgi:hypothetical protein
MKILVVDDHPLVRDAMANLLAAVAPSNDDPGNHRLSERTRDRARSPTSTSSCSTDAIVTRSPKNAARRSTIAVTLDTSASIAPAWTLRRYLATGISQRSSL